MTHTTRLVALSLILAASTSSFASTAVMTTDLKPVTAPMKLSQGLTREQVRQDLLEAHRNGLLHANPNQYPSEYIEHAQRQLNTLASDDVKVHPKALIE
jgi:hypothetical protein